MNVTITCTLMYARIETRAGSVKRRLKVLDEFYELAMRNGIRRLSEWGNRPDEFRKKYLAELEDAIKVRYVRPGRSLL